MLHEVFAGKSLVLLLGGLVIGWIAGPDGMATIDNVFFDLFKGLLAFFLLEMGLVVAKRFGDLRRAGVFLIVRIALPQANPALSIGAALGITFPFNLVVGIPLYHWLAQQLHRAGA